MHMQGDCLRHFLCVFSLAEVFQMTKFTNYSRKEGWKTIAYKFDAQVIVRISSAISVQFRLAFSKTSSSQTRLLNRSVRDVVF